MVEVVVVGGSYAGIAAAARLAKLGHRVTLCERDPEIAGELRPLERDGFAWDAVPPTMLLPAPLRDLFHKSGRPLDRVAELVPVDSARRHIHPTGTVDLPLTGRGRQVAAFTAARGETAAAAWTRLVDGYEPAWECLRTRVLEIPFDGAVRRADRRLLHPWRSLAARARRLPDPLLRAVLEHWATRTCSRPAETPSFVGVLSYVERTFGRWWFPGGMGVLRNALARRLTERRVDVRTDAEVVRVTTHGGRVTGVRLRDDESIPAEIVVSAVNAQRLYGALLEDPPRTRVHRARPASLPAVVHLGLREALDDVPVETVVHPERRGGGTIVLYGQPDPRAWTIATYGDPGGDPLAILAHHGIDLRDRVVTRVDGVARAAGFAWRGVRTARQRAATRSAIAGLYCVGPTAHPGAGLPFEALGAAAVAELVGKAPRVRAAS